MMDQRKYETRICKKFIAANGGTIKASQVKVTGYSASPGQPSCTLEYSENGTTKVYRYLMLEEQFECCTK